MAIPSPLQRKEYRQQICEADARIQKVEAVWNVTQTEFSDPNFDEAALRANMETIRPKNQSAAEWAAFSEPAIERDRERAANGRVATRRNVYQRDGQITRRLEAAPTGISSGLLLVWDDAQALCITNYGVGRVNIECPTHWHKLDHILLCAAPVSALYSEVDDAIIDETDDMIVWERRKISNDPITTLVTFSKAHLRPIEIVKRDWRNGQIFSRRVAEAYQEIAGGVWFPSRLVESVYYGFEQPRRIVTHELAELRLNDAVDFSALPPAIAEGDQVEDCRWGPHNICVYPYRLKSGLPTDAQIQAIVNRRRRRGTLRRLLRLLLTGGHGAPALR